MPGRSDKPQHLDNLVLNLASMREILKKRRPVGVSNERRDQWLSWLDHAIWLLRNGDKEARNEDEE